MSWIRGEIIGRGSSAAVSVATSRRSGEILAVKSAELWKSEFLQREQRIFSTLNCPQIVEYKGCDVTCEDNKVMFNLVMEHMPGGSLVDAARKRGGRLDEPAVGRYTRQIVQGLEYLHSMGVIHCDIKGTNILLGKNCAKIADFGCSKLIKGLNPDLEGSHHSCNGDQVNPGILGSHHFCSGDSVNPGILGPAHSCSEKEVNSQMCFNFINPRIQAPFSADTIGGTPLFMAPEVVQGKEQGFPADIWSLGCTIIEMASGSPPWPNVTNPATLLYTIAFSGEIPAIPDFLSDQARDFLEKCLRRDPDQRWTAKQLLGHPFLEQFESFDEQFQENQELDSISPTSVLDQGIWSSSSSEAVQKTNPLNSPMQRVRKLCSNSELIMSDWNNSSWITIRRRDFSGEKNLLLCDSVSCCTSSTDSSILRQKFVDNSQTLGHQKERVVNQLPLFYIFFSLLLLSFHFIPIPIKENDSLNMPQREYFISI